MIGMFTYAYMYVRGLTVVRENCCKGGDFRYPVCALDPLSLHPFGF